MPVLKYFAHQTPDGVWHCCYQVNEHTPMVSMCAACTETPMRELAAKMQAAYDKGDRDE